MAEPIRGRVSPYTFLGRFQPQQQQQQVENAETNIALRRNQFAIANVNNSLVRITEQINVLSASLQGISTQIKETSSLETLKEQQKVRQEKVLAEQQIREGKESQIERKIQAALVAPLQKGGAKARGSLFNLGRFFSILLGGFLVNRILKSASELSEKGRPLGKEIWAGAIDSVGSHTLANICATTKYGGVVAACGLAQGFDFPSTVMPFILRGVSLLGVDSVYHSIEGRKEAWMRLEKDLNLEHLTKMTQVISLDDVDQVAKNMLENKTFGRIVVDVNL